MSVLLAEILGYNSSLSFTSLLCVYLGRYLHVPI